MNVDPKLVF